MQAGPQVVVGAEQAGGHAPPQGDDAGPGQGRQVDDGFGLEALGIGQGVGQDEAALGVGVEDLDGLAIHGQQHISRLVGAAAGHVLCGRHQSDDV